MKNSCKVLSHWQQNDGKEQKSLTCCDEKVMERTRFIFTRLLVILTLKIYGQGTNEVFNTKKMVRSREAWSADNKARYSSCIHNASRQEKDTIWRSHWIILGEWTSWGLVVSDTRSWLREVCCGEHVNSTPPIKWLSELGSVIDTDFHLRPTSECSFIRAKQQLIDSLSCRRLSFPIA